MAISISLLLSCTLRGFELIFNTGGNIETEQFIITLSNQATKSDESIAYDIMDTVGKIILDIKLQQTDK